LRLVTAIEKKEKIIVFGDYDVDGITGTAILWETLHYLGAKTLPYIPHRLDEGYGLSIKGIENVKNEQPDVSLIITVDNGIVANEAVKFANTQGIEVIITDHHTIGVKLPEAYSIVHTTKLCGAGVAYVLTRKLCERRELPPLEDHLELAALGTVADLVPLVDGNRTIVKFGLKSLSHTKRPGLLALFQEAALEQSSLGVYHIGHIIAPRLNAAGRLDTAMDSLRLICTRDMRKAHELAALLGTTNRERQNIMFEATKHAVERVRGQEAEMKSLLFIGHESYPEGVIGLVAGRLVEEFYRPAIVLSLRETHAKASARSISGFNMIEFLRSFPEDFINVGGHPMAAGFTIAIDNFELLKTKLEAKAEELLTEELLTRSLKIDCELSLMHITQELYDEMQKLGPFGMANPEPVFSSHNVEVVEWKVIGKEGKHMRLIVKENDSPYFEAIAFGMAEQLRSLNIGDIMSLAYTIDENEWNGRKKLQLKVKDIVLKTI
jgi:single-stranded-DNA-specific exonuclease